jgi:hypothetical protein
MSFTAAQTAQLLKPIARQRVLADGKGHSHVSQQDVTAHLIRMFGFGNFDTEVLAVDCVFERPTASVSKGKKEPDPNRYDVCYRALLRLTVRDEAGARVCSYEDGSTATALNQTLGDAHDLAYKSAISLAKKRCAINLGDQFGLSLYNKGQTSALVLGTLVGAGEAPEDVQADVPQQVSLGNDETDYDPTPTADPTDVLVVQRFEELIDGATTSEELQGIASEIASSPVAGADREALRRRFADRVKAVAA